MLSAFVKSHFNLFDFATVKIAAYLFEEFAEFDLTDDFGIPAITGYIKLIHNNNNKLVNDKNLFINR